MSDQEVDLNALIQSDRRRDHFQREKKREDRRHERNSYQDSNRDYDDRDRSRDDRRGRPQRQERRDRQPTRKKYVEKPLVIESYAIHAKGFVSDVSLDDILKLAKGKKIINVKAFLDREDGQPLQQGRDSGMSVIINFVQKRQADEFIKEYADKKLDGKTPLQFQFRRGMAIRKPKFQHNQKRDNQNNNQKAQRKSQE